MENKAPLKQKRKAIWQAFINPHSANHYLADMLEMVTGIF
jgi:hypothetical protein